LSVRGKILNLQRTAYSRTSYVQQQQQKKQDAERLLEAVKNNEKNTMKENAKRVEAATSAKIEKDW
jgi:uncharacterized membrane-anchored protein